MALIELLSEVRIVERNEVPRQAAAEHAAEPAAIVQPGAQLDVKFSGCVSPTKGDRPCRNSTNNRHERCLISTTGYCRAHQGQRSAGSRRDR